MKFLSSLSLCTALLSPAVLGKWVELSPLPTRRSDMTCSLHSSSVYVMGGCSSDQVYEDEYSECHDISTRLDRYDVLADTWHPLEAMPRARHRHVTLEYSGKLYVFGGRDTEDKNVREVDVYDIASGKWSTLETLYEQATSDFAGFVEGGKAVLMGGYLEDYSSTNLTHSFDFGTSTFSYHVAEMNKDRGDVCAASLLGRGFVFGGFQDRDFCAPINYLEELSLNPSSPLSWTPSTPFNDAVNGGDGACVPHDGKFLSLGGEIKTSQCYSDCLDRVESYDPATDHWEEETSMALSSKRFRFCGVSYDHQVYVFGGQGPLVMKGDHASHSILAIVERFEEDDSSARALLPALLPAMAFAFGLVSTLL